MAIEQLIRALEADARGRAADVLREARAEARRIREEAAGREARRREEFLSRVEEEVRAGLDEVVATARREARERALRSRANLLERIFEEAGARLPAAAGTDAYLDALPGRIDEASRYLPAGPAEVECPPALEGAVRAALEGRSGLRIEARREAAPGVRVRSADGRVTVDDTLTGRLERMRPELEIRLAARLEDGP